MFFFAGPRETRHKPRNWRELRVWVMCRMKVGWRAMRKGYITDFPGSKIYFTEGDHSAQRFYRISADDFNVKIKLWLLLVDHMILSAGHMLHSPLTFDWLKQNRKVISELQGENAILPSLREDREGFREFVTKDPEGEDQPTLLRNQKDILVKRAEILSDVFQTAISWSPIDESHWFRDAIVKDLTDKDSPLRKRMVGISKVAIEQLATDIGSLKFLNRETLVGFVRRHCPKRERLLLRYGDIFYYLSGALFKDAFPVFHPEAAALCREKISHAVYYSGPNAYEKGEIWHDIIDTWGLTYTALQRLPLSEIANIRRDSLGVRLRQTWGTLMEQARHSQIKEQNTLAFQRAKDELIELFKRELNFQKKRYVRMQRIRGMLEVGSWVTGGLSAVAGFLLTSNPIFSIIAGSAGFFAGKPILDVVGKSLPKTELVILATKIQHGLYNDP